MNWARRAWSPSADRAYHDDVFQGARYDPTDPAYPGWVTIRRFADLAGPHVSTSRTVLDLGCGPGEITCELARRFPEVRITGVDHSVVAIERAQAQASRMGLANVTFVAEDLSTFSPQEPVDLIALFDAFHHIPDPDAFVARFGQFTSRFFLMEPAGNWYGGWQQDVNLDWLAESVFLMRDRLELHLDAVAPAPPGAPARPRAGEPIERRYPIEDFERMFRGYGIEVRGTAAGIERYGTRPEATSPLRRDVGELTARLFEELDALLRKHDLDLAAKHWAIYAERGRHVAPRVPPQMNTPRPAADQPLAGPYDASYSLREVPAPVTADAVFHLVVDVTNKGWRTWTSDPPLPIYLSSRVLDGQGRVVIADGPRSSWPRPVPPGESCSVHLAVQAPAAAGRYRLQIDGVHEGVTWFSQTGVPPLTMTLEVIAHP
jgi:SAM-dependent methyltransferase